MNIYVESQEYRKKVLEGIELAVNFIKKSYGYNGKSIVIKRDNAENHISNDGVTIAQNIYSDDPIVDIGCDIVRKATKMVEEKVKNNTTTTAILIHSLIKDLSTIVDNSNVIELKLGLNNLIDKTISNLLEMTVEIDSSKSIAYDSCHDADMASFVSDLLRDNDEYYELNSEPGDEYKIEVDDSAAFDMHVYAVKNNGKTNIKDPVTIIYENTIENNLSLTHIFNVIKDKDAVIVLKNLIPAMEAPLKSKINLHKGGIICFIGLNGREEIIRDIKTIYHHSELNYGNGMVPVVKLDKIKKISFSNKKIHITGETNKESTKKVIVESKAEFSNSADQLKAEVIKRKINKYMGRTYKVTIKGNEYNFDGQKDKFLDTINDVINFNNSGNRVVAGGGVVYKDLANMLFNDKDIVDKNNDSYKMKGITINMLREPMKVLLSNSYADTDLEKYEKYYGYNAIDRKLTNMIDAKILTSIISIITSLNVVRDVGIEWLFTDGAIYMP